MGDDFTSNFFLPEKDGEKSAQDTVRKLVSFDLTIIAEKLCMTSFSLKSDQLEFGHSFL